MTQHPPSALIRQRSPIVHQAQRLLARHILAQPAASGEPLRKVLAEDRVLDDGVVELTSAIERGSWGAALDDLAQRLGLSALEQSILGLLLAPELDADFRLALERATGDRALRGLDSDLLRGLLDPVNERTLEIATALDQDGRLRRYALVSVQLQEGRRLLQLAPRVVRHVLGDRALDDGLRAGLTMLGPSKDVPIDRAIVDAVEVMANLGGARRWLMVGPEGVGQTEAAAWLAADANEELLVVDVAVLLAGRTPVEVVRLGLREARLAGALPFFQGIDAILDARFSAGERAQALRRLSLEPGPLFLAVPRRTPELARWLRDLGEPEPLVFTHPSSEQRLTLWRHACGDIGEADLTYVANAYALAPAAIHRAAAGARNAQLVRGSDDPPTRRQLEEACREETTHRLTHLATRVTVRVDWDDVVLPTDTLATMREIVLTSQHRDQVHERWGFRRHLPTGGGLSILFSGDPGTGKTMVAGLIARDIGVELYKVDLSRIVSKYIGETEKQLSEIFDEAQAARVALLFDEADSMFGKRTEVKSSTDRYANLEVGYLLQKMDEFDGLTVLTTNLKKSIDEAFMRRIRFRVEFPAPEVEEREKLWQVLLPKETPRQGQLDFHALAVRYELSGGHIRNAVLRAAFLAASEDSPVTQSHLDRGARSEYQEMGRIHRA
jgi:AAA+ superfamily predicted ATPase